MGNYTLITLNVALRLTPCLNLPLWLHLPVFFLQSSSYWNGLSGKAYSCSTAIEVMMRKQLRYLHWCFATLTADMTIWCIINAHFRSVLNPSIEVCGLSSNMTNEYMLWIVAVMFFKAIGMILRWIVRDLVDLMYARNLARVQTPERLWSCPPCKQHWLTR